LITLTRATLTYADPAAAQLSRAADPIAATLWQAEFRHYRPPIERIVAQTERRVLRGEAVPANEKIVSLFEPHADITVKGGREVQYGHKLNLTTGRSGLILDLVIEAGNPADSDRFLPMLKRHIAFYGEAPRQTAADGGFASRDNLAHKVERAHFFRRLPPPATSRRKRSSARRYETGRERRSCQPPPPTQVATFLGVQTSRPV